MDGGGENRTLVLGKLHKNDYMLIAFRVKPVLMEDAPLETGLLHLVLNAPPKQLKREFTPRLMTIVAGVLGQTPGYRQLKAVKL